MKIKVVLRKSVVPPAKPKIIVTPKFIVTPKTAPPEKPLNALEALFAKDRSLFAEAIKHALKTEKAPPMTFGLENAIHNLRGGYYPCSLDSFTLTEDKVAKAAEYFWLFYLTLKMRENDFACFTVGRSHALAYNRAAVIHLPLGKTTSLFKAVKPSKQQAKRVGAACKIPEAAFFQNLPVKDYELLTVNNDFVKNAYAASVVNTLLTPKFVSVINNTVSVNKKVESFTAWNPLLLYSISASMHFTAKAIGGNVVAYVPRSTELIGSASVEQRYVRPLILTNDQHSDCWAMLAQYGESHYGVIADPYSIAGYSHKPKDKLTRPVLAQKV